MVSLVRLKRTFAKKRPQNKKKKVLVHQDNALYHKSIKTLAKLHELQFELLPHPPHFPDLALSDPKQNASGKEIWLQ